MRVLIMLATTMLLGLTGCATNYGTRPAGDVTAAVQVRDSTFDARRIYAGPPSFSETSRFPFVDNETARLVAFKDKATGQVTHAVTLMVMYSGGWRFYESVSLPGGTTVSLHEVKRDVNACMGAGCTFTEQMALELTDDQAQAARSGLQFRVNARSGHSNIITLPGEYVRGFLATTFN
jgi:hypothetical protein